MNENIDLMKILKDCPKGWKFYSTIFEEVEFIGIKEDRYQIKFEAEDGEIYSVTSNGRHRYEYNGECTLFPSKDQRDWSKFTAPWLNKERFDPKTLKAFDRVLVRDNNDTENWSCDFFSYIGESDVYKYISIKSGFKQCIPYNDETKHLVGTKDEAPDFYRYWED